MRSSGGIAVKEKTEQDAWSRLNTRQHLYMKAIFEADQAQERNERQRASMDQRSQSAKKWCWITYADTIHGHTPLKQRLVDGKVVDPGTGSTFKALEERGYILVKSEHVAPHPRSDVIVYVRLTTKGRALVRKALNLSPFRTVPVGTLREWHWRALTLAYRNQGVGLSREGSATYGRIGWNVWVRLRNYMIHGVDSPLVEEDGGLHITKFGIAYYERSHTRYTDLYPTLVAPVPTALCDPLEPYVDIIQDTRVCRACHGQYLVAVSRTYRQSATHLWRVEAQEQRVEGLVVSRYSNVRIEQCLCQEADIQELTDLLLPLLDRLTTDGWQICFPYHHWFSSLDYLVGGVVSGREVRWHDPALVQERVRPLLEDTDRDESRNAAKAMMHYYWNERVRKGSIYPDVLGEEHRQPIALTQQREVKIT